MPQITFPLNIQEVIKLIPNCRYMSYQKFAKINNCSINDVIQMCESKSGCTHYDISQDRYLILCNQSTQDNNNSGRQLWTCTHEIGHILCKHHSTSAYLKLLHRLLDHAGCERVRFHDLRHTFATNALAHGMDIKTLSTILGHVSAATTLNTYSHITEEMRRQAAARIDAGIAKAQPLPAEGNALQERTMTDFQARKRWSRRTA